MFDCKNASGGFAWARQCRCARSSQKRQGEGNTGLDTDYTMLHRLVPRRIMLDPLVGPLLLLHRLRTLTASCARGWPPCQLRIKKKGKEVKTQAPPTMDHAGPSTAPASTTGIDCFTSCARGWLPCPLRRGKKARRKKLRPRPPWIMLDP